MKYTHITFSLQYLSTLEGRKITLFLGNEENFICFLKFCCKHLFFILGSWYNTLHVLWEKD